MINRDQEFTELQTRLSQFTNSARTQYERVLAIGHSPDFDLAGPKAVLLSLIEGAELVMAELTQVLAGSLLGNLAQSNYIELTNKFELQIERLWDELVQFDMQHDEILQQL